MTVRTIGAAGALVSLLVLAAPASGAVQPNITCGVVATTDITLHRDLLGCHGDGIVIAAAGVDINLNGHRIEGTNTPGSAGIRNLGHDDVVVRSSKPFATIAEFPTGVAISDASGNRVERVHIDHSTFGIRLEQVDHAVLLGNDVGFFEGGPPLVSCSPVTAPSGILLLASSGNLLKGNFTQLTGTGIVLVGSDHNRLEANGAAPGFSDGNDCNGIAMLGSDANVLIGNDAAQDRSGFPGGGNGFVVDAGSDNTVLRSNTAAFDNHDGFVIGSASTVLIDNTATSNDGHGFVTVPGVTARRNHASGNGDPVQCVNIICVA
jgi:parallel beta-helix repeat protein